MVLRRFVVFSLLAIALKAKFKITLTVPKHMEALSNMPGKVTDETESQRTFSFEESPIMSTYLVAFVVGQFEYVEKVI